MRPEFDQELTEVVVRLRAGESVGQGDLERLLRKMSDVAQRHLRRRTRKLTSDESAAESALRSFVLRPNPSGLDLADPEGLWLALLQFVVRHCEKWNKRARAAKRDPNREAYNLNADSVEGKGPELADDDAADPSEGVLLAEVVCRLMNGLSEKRQVVVELALQGYSRTEISEKLGEPYHIIRRTFEAIEERLLQMNTEET